MIALGRSWPALLLAAFVVAAAAAPIVTPFPPDRLDLAHRHEAPSATHWFGTDALGRDVLTRVVYGARVSLAVGLLSAAIAGLLGVLLGGAAGYAGGTVDDAVMRATDAAIAMPRLPLLMTAAAVLQPDIWLLVLLIGLASWMETARVMRAECLSLRSQEFIDAARALGAGHARILLVHLLPGAAPAVAVSATLAVGRGILLESALSFFGVGIRPPQASWGNMLYQAQATFGTEPWLAFFPGLFIFVTALSVNLTGDRIATSGGSTKAS